MKVVKIVASVLVAYVAIVAAAVGAVAYFQPDMPGLVVLTTTDAEGEVYDRLLGRIEVDGVFYLSANAWPRRWYNRALANPEVELTVDGRRMAFTAVRVDKVERQRLLAYPIPLWRKVLAGFPPRRFLRLDPR